METQRNNMGDPPPTAQGADAILDEYFRERRAAIPNRPRIGERRIRGLVLACKGSTPGVDGVPYELYHWGAFFEAALLAQGVWVAGIAFEGGE